jgi:hypothetical protein
MTNATGAQVPQSDRLLTVRKVLAVLCRDPGTLDRLTEQVSLSYRQVGYALNAINLLGLAYRSDDGSWMPTDEGRVLDATVLESPDEKNLLRSAILKTDFGRATAPLWDVPPRFLPKENISKIILDTFKLSETTCKRRTNTLIAWARYLSQTSSQPILPLPTPQPDGGEFDALTYPAAVRHLFELNNFAVESPFKVRGSEIDLKATSKTEPFANPIYIEATIQYVDNTKYGKDLTKLVQVKNDDPGCKCVITSSKGFSPDVIERAPGAKVELYTWPDLRAKFERFDDYLKTIITRKDLRDLNSVYEEPYFDDEHGADLATSWCTALVQSLASRNWVVISGEYGTGKTALTKVLEYRWAKAHLQDPALPIPFRIELRNFGHQFNARTLVYDFLDRNGLTHLSVDYVFSLIHAGRVVLLLDGYDEMAQHMHIRERRTCLEALAGLSAQGARGLLTSRPNYFSESEELQLFELLYRDLEFVSSMVRPSFEQIANKEREIDKLLEDHFLDRKERSLRDLSPEQTEALVRRVLAGDIDGQRLILKMLDNVFKASVSSGRYSLGGKPVIVTYLLEIIEDLKADEHKDGDDRLLTEWSVYTLIVEKLMVRDYQQRTTVITPAKRREFLELLAARVSQSTHGGVTEAVFRDYIREFFKNEIAKYFADGREAEVERHFADLRSSSTLTVLDEGATRVWRFSHNSLREFLACNRLLVRMSAGLAPDIDYPVTDAMKAFVASKSREEIFQLAADFIKCRRLNTATASIGRYFELLHMAAYRFAVMNGGDAAGGAVRLITEPQTGISDLAISRIDFSRLASTSDLSELRASGAALADCGFADAHLNNADFSASILESVTFQGCDLSGCSFRGAALLDVNFSQANLSKACFEAVSHDEIMIQYEGKDASVQGTSLSGLVALGFLASKGAIIDSVIDIRYVFMHDERYLIFEKICRKLMEQGWRQRRGLEQRGAAQQNQKFGKEAVGYLIKCGVVAEDKAKREDLVCTTPAGRSVIQQFLDGQAMPSEFRVFLIQTIGHG